MLTDLARRLRQSHAIEHAAVAVLLERRGGRRMRVGGLSHPWGFWLFCPSASEEDVTEATRAAVSRLQAGEWHLALSDYCGTNLGVAALTTTLTVRLAAMRRASLPATVTTAAMALVAAPVLGLTLQRSVTTLADVRDRAFGGTRVLARWPSGTIYHVRLD